MALLEATTYLIDRGHEAAAGDVVPDDLTGHEPEARDALDRQQRAIEMSYERVWTVLHELPLAQPSAAAFGASAGDRARTRRARASRRASPRTASGRVDRVRRSRPRARRRGRRG